MDLLVLAQRRFNGLLESVPTIARKLLVAMSSRLRDADARATAYRLSGRRPESGGHRFRPPRR